MSVLLHILIKCRLIWPCTPDTADAAIWPWAVVWSTLVLTAAAAAFRRRDL